MKQASLRLTGVPSIAGHPLFIPVIRIGDAVGTQVVDNLMRSRLENGRTHRTRDRFDSGREQNALVPALRVNRRRILDVDRNFDWLRFGAISPSE